MLNVSVAIEIGSETLWMLTLEHIDNKLLHQRFIFGCLFCIFNGYCAIERCVARGGFAAVIRHEIVPMLYDFAIFEAENIKSCLSSKEVIIGLCHHEVAIFESTDSVHARLFWIICQAS